MDNDEILHRRTLKDMKRATSSPEKQTEWVCVPREPTPEMLGAAQDYSTRHAKWKAMLAASPGGYVAVPRWVVDDIERNPDKPPTEEMLHALLAAQNMERK